jgi:Uma2 family endonuclease
VVTIAAFDAFLDAQQGDSLWELVAGRITAMTDPTEEHEQIAGNLGARLKLAMDAKGCRAYQGGIRVQRSEGRQAVDKPRPDIVVRCGPSGGRNVITDPLVVAEVLSPSTMDLDRSEKLRFYKGLPTLRHIALIYQDQMWVEHYRKTDLGWISETLIRPDDTLCFEAVGFSIDLAQVYSGVELGNASRQAG